MKILYDDKYLAVVEKDVGSSSETDGSGNDVITLASDKLGCGLYPVHRLDKTTGGAIILAKDADTAAKLSEAVASREIVKEYLAVVCGSPAEESGIYEDLLFRDVRKNKTYVVDRKRRGVKEASLEYRVIGTAQDERLGTLSLVRIKLHTGRTHQIRVQFSSRKTPLAGDGKYGRGDNRCAPALWSTRICFVHPVSGENIECESMPSGGFPWDLFNM